MPDMIVRLVQMACGFALVYAAIALAGQMLPMETSRGISAPDTTFYASRDGSRSES